MQPSQHYEQPPQLFWNCGPHADTEFVNVSDETVGTAFTRPLVGRGASYADIDGDGDLDVVIATTGQKPRLLRNEQATGHQLVRIKLAGDVGNPQAIGALVELRVKDSLQRRRVGPTKSYLSQSELPVTFGVGDVDEIREVRVFWPEGTVNTVQEIPLGSEFTISKAVSQ